MKSFLLVASGIVLCLLVGAGIFAFQMMTHPVGALTNEDFPLIKVSRDRGDERFDLTKGESKLLDYGEYTISVPQLNASFGLLKNSRGTCHVRLAKGILLVEVNENARIFASPEESKPAEQDTKP